MMEKYVTFDPEPGVLTGAYWQEPVPEHDRRLLASDAQYAQWTNYCVNNYRTGLVLALPVPPSDEVRRARYKQQRAQRLAAIVVDVDGLPFDGDEDSVRRMAGAIVGMEIAGLESFAWTLADNTRREVTLDQLRQALVLSAQEQARVWALDAPD